MKRLISIGWLLASATLLCGCNHSQPTDHRADAASCPDDVKLKELIGVWRPVELASKLQPDALRTIPQEFLFRVYAVDPFRYHGGLRRIYAELLVRAPNGELIPLASDADGVAYSVQNELHIGALGSHYTFYWKLHGNRLDMVSPADGSRFRAVFKRVSHEPPSGWPSHFSPKPRD